jgi:copper(I)-binding protein
MRWVLAFWLMTGTAFAAGAPPVSVSGGWARASLPHQDEAAAYLTLLSAGGDTLTGVESPAAGMVMLHRTVRKNGVAEMDDVDSLALPAGRAVALAPGGTHLMLMDVAQPLKAGGTLHLTLHFAKAGDVPVSVPVLPVGATGPAP